MLMKSSAPQGSGARVLVLTCDPALEQSMHGAAANSARLEVSLRSGCLPHDPDEIPFDEADVLVIDVDASPADDPQALERLVVAVDGRLPVIAVTQAFHEQIARRLLHLRLA